MVQSLLFKSYVATLLIKIYVAFMELGSSLSRSQKPTIEPYSKPVESG
jgi:hypothetical protein